jgi:hypothetical protein
MRNSWNQLVKLNSRFLHYDNSRMLPCAPACGGTLELAKECKMETNMLDQTRLNKLKELIEIQTELRDIQNGYTSLVHAPDWEVTIVPRRKYTLINIGRSARYVIENATGIIYGCKAYGVVHKGHVYGTLNTIEEWNWGGYTAIKRITN